MNFYQYQSYTEVKDEAIKDTEWKKKIIVFLYKNKLSFIQISYTVAKTVLYLCLSAAICKVCIFNSRTMLLLVMKSSCDSTHTLKKLETEAEFEQCFEKSHKQR